MGRRLRESPASLLLKTERVLGERVWAACARARVQERSSRVSRSAHLSLPPFAPQVGPDGNIYAIPSDSTRALKIDVASGTVTMFGDLPKTKNKWQGGVVGGDGVIYGIPRGRAAPFREETCTFI